MTTTTLRRYLTAAFYGLVVGCTFVGIAFLCAAVPTTPSKPVVVASPSPSPSPTPIPYVIGQDRMISIWTKQSLGHGCPISSTEALTAEHVATLEREGGFGVVPMLWGDQLGNSGTLEWIKSDIRRDLSLVRILPGTHPFTGYFRIAAEEPAIGDFVYIIGFEYEKGLGDYTVKAKVVGSQAGVLVYDDTPGPGSSGSCTLNARGEVVAINVAMINGKGLGLLVAGNWKDIPKEFAIK